MNRFMKDYRIDGSSSFQRNFLVFRGGKPLLLKHLFWICRV